MFSRVRGAGKPRPRKPTRRRRRPTAADAAVSPLLAELKSTPDLSSALELFYSADPRLHDYPSSASLLYRLARSRRLDDAAALLSFLRSRCLRFRNDTLFNALLRHYSEAHLPDKALDLFHSIPTFNCPPAYPTPQSLNTLLDALVENGRSADAEDLLRASPEMGIRPNAVSYNVLIKGRLRSRDLEGARQLLDEMRQRGITPSVVTYNTFIGFLSRNGALKEAMEMKDGMDKRGMPRANAVTYALLMQGICMEGRFADARKMLFDMEYWGCRPRPTNYAVLMSELGREGKVEEVRELLEEMKRRRRKPDVVAYGILINCLCRQGRAEEAYRVMVEMQMEGCMPSAAVYRMVLDGFCKVGRYEEGLGVLNAMLVDGHCAREESFRRLVVGLCACRRFEDVCVVAEEMGRRRMDLGLEGWGALVVGVVGEEGHGVVGEVPLEELRRWVRSGSYDRYDG